METQKNFQSRPDALWSATRVWLPSRGTVLFAIVLAALLFFTNRAGAFPFLAPTANSTSVISYQGRLTDAGGAPLTGAYDMVFRFYSASSGGSPLWSESWTDVQVTDGLFNVMLGSVTAIPQSVVTSNSNLWLGIKVGTDNEMTPRAQLGSVPFATQALTVSDGSITTAKIASEAVTQLDSASGVTGDYTSSTTFVDIPGKSVTLTTTGGPVLALFSGSHYPTSDGVVGYWRIIRDDSVVIAYNNHSFEITPNQWATTAIFGTDTPPAGVHIYKVQWRVSQGTMGASVGVYSENFAVVEFKR